MISHKQLMVCAAIAALSVSTGFAIAGVSADSAAKLKTTLTPLGGERAANMDGSIPAWSGGQTGAVGGAKVGDIPVSLFPNQKPVFQINASNMVQYADKLSEGTQALLKKFPETFYLEIYQSQRTAVAPQYVYDNTFKNATDCKLIENGMSVEGCFGGIPFPVPQSGVEIIWNFLLRIEPEAKEYGFKNFVISANGERSLATRNNEFFQHPYYYKDGSAEKWSGRYFIQRFSTTAPPFKAGESLVIHDSIDSSNPRTAWQYLVGQRRVRRAPTVGYDTPDFVSSGANYFDEVFGFFGHPDRYEWKLVGKREMYIPYNNNELVTASDSDAFSKFHMNPSKVRWELHRVWEVEATVAAGKRHAVPKRKFYFDEDTWLIALADGYDAQGNLWRTAQLPSFFVPTVPAVLNTPSITFNLQANTVSTNNTLHGESYRVVPRKPETFFTGDAVAAEASR